MTGVQAKLSADIEHDETGNAQRLTIVGVMESKFGSHRQLFEESTRDRRPHNAPCR